MKIRVRLEKIDEIDPSSAEMRRPVAADIGAVLIPVKIVARFVDSAGHEAPVETAEGRLAVDPGFLAVLTEAAEAPGELPDSLAGLAESVVWFYTCVTADGRLVDVADFEVSAL